ncbi:MAG: hypothetical protein ACRCY8_06660 [Dermatophilaceae bacterium]
MPNASHTVAEQRSVLEAARQVAAELTADSTCLSETEVAEMMTLIDEVAAQAGAARVGLTVETARRTELTVRELSGWVAEHAPSLRQGGASAVAKVAAEVVAPSRSSALSGGGPLDPDPACPVGIV